MSRKTRKLIWSAPLLAVLAVAAALAMFAAQTPIGAQAQDAQDMLGPPLELTATKVGQTVIELAWKAPATGDVTAYRVDESDDGMVWMERVASIDDPFYDRINLDPGDTKYYRVFAIYGDKGEGEPSETASATTDAATAPGKPAAPTLAGGTPSDVSGIAVSWVAPSSDGGSPITGYQIERLKDGDDDWMTAKADTGLTSAITANCGATGATVATCTYQDTGLIHSTQYHYRVSAINKVGTGEASATEDATTGASTTGPAGPTGLTAQGTNAAVTLHWLAPSDPDGDPIIKYEVERSPDGTDWTKIADVKATRTYHRVGGAFSTDETPWQYRVRGVSSTPGGGNGLYSTVLDDGPPNAATHGPAQNLRVLSKSPLMIDVSWRPATGTATVLGTTTYRVDYSNDGHVWKAVPTADVPAADALDATSGRFSFDDDELKIGERRYYRVIAETSATLHQMTGAEPATAGAPDKPGKPTGLVFNGNSPDPTIPTADMIPLTWVAPTATGGSPITGYKIERSLNAATGWMTIVANTGTTALTYVDKKLTANTQYYYRVSAITAGGTGPASDTEDATTTHAGAPGIPSGLVAVERGTSQVDLYWLAPDPQPGAPVTGYKIEVSEDDGATWRTVEDDTESTTTMYSHTGLTGDDTRIYRVSAISSVGESAPSLTDTAMAGTTPTLPGMPQNVSAMVDADTPTTINVTWEAAEANVGAVTGYMVQSAYMMADDTMSAWTNVDPAHSGMAMMYMDTGLMAETKYYYRVRAMNANGYGEYSDGTAYAMTGTDNTDPIDVGTIDPVTVEAGMSSDAMDVTMYFGDADGDTLTYRAMSSDDTIADATVSGSMLTITGVAEGEATITVYASDGMGGTDAMQTIMVMVTPAALGAPTNVMARVDDSDPGEPDVVVTWTDGENSDAHWVGLYDVVNYRTYRSDRVAGDPSAMTYTFSNVEPGIYLPAVISTLEGFAPMVDYARLDDGRPRLTQVEEQ